MRSLDSGKDQPLEHQETKAGNEFLLTDHPPKSAMVNFRKETCF